MLLCGKTDSFLSLYAEYTLEQLHELVEEELRIRGSAGCFRMELCREPGIRLMAYSFVRAIIHIDKQRFPVGAKCIIVYRITMILRSDETTFRANHAYRLVVATVSIFKFVNLCPSGFREQLVAPCKFQRWEVFRSPSPCGYSVQLRRRYPGHPVRWR